MRGVSRPRGRAPGIQKHDAAIEDFMAVKLRLVRLGRRHRAFFRLRAGDERYPPTGRFLEELGCVDPLEKDA